MIDIILTGHVVTLIINPRHVRSIKLAIASLLFRGRRLPSRHPNKLYQAVFHLLNKIDNFPDNLAGYILKFLGHQYLRQMAVQYSGAAPGVGQKPGYIAQ